MRDGKSVRGMDRKPVMARLHGIWNKEQKEQKV